MNTRGDKSARLTVGTLELYVRYVGDSPEQGGGTRPQFRYTIESADPDLDASYVGRDLYAGVGATVTAADMVRT